MASGFRTLADKFITRLVKRAKVHTMVRSKKSFEDPTYYRNNEVTARFIAVKDSKKIDKHSGYGVCDHAATIACDQHNHTFSTGREKAHWP